MRFAPGDTVGPYRVTSKIGEGATGVVYQVVNGVTGRLEAMKILANDGRHDLDQAQRFLREIQFQAKLEHPNIAQVHTGFCEGTTLVMVMEQVDGEPLSELIRRGPVPLQQALGIVSQVLTALEFAHARQVIHRDVKPANILIARDGKVKLTDFGLAKQQNDPSQSNPGHAAGTVYYMAPEQVRANAAIDHRVDIYASAIVLYEMLTARRPFDGSDHFTVMRAQVECVPPPASHWLPGLPAHIDAALARALQKDPAARFQSVAEFRAALSPHSAAIAIPIPPRRSTSPWKFSAVMLSTAAVLLAAFSLPPWLSSRANAHEHLDLPVPAAPAPPAIAYLPTPPEPVANVAAVAPAPPHAKPATRRRPATTPLFKANIHSAPDSSVESPEPIAAAPKPLTPPPNIAISTPAPSPEPQAALPAATLPEKPQHPLRRAISRFPRIFRSKPQETKPPANPN